MIEEIERLQQDNARYANAHHILMIERDTLQKRVAALERLVYVPGLWHCPKCEFSLIRTALNVVTGTATADDSTGEKCPNCNSPLWRVTERDASNQLADRMEKLQRRCDEPPAARHDDLREIVSLLDEQYPAEWFKPEASVRRAADALRAIVERPSQPPADVLERLSDARLDWGMQCECECAACRALDWAIRTAVTKESAPAGITTWDCIGCGEQFVTAPLTYCEDCHKRHAEIAARDAGEKPNPPYEFVGMDEDGNPVRQSVETRESRSNDWDDPDTYGPSA